MFTGRYTKFLSVRSEGCRTGMWAAFTLPTTVWRWKTARDAYTRRSEGCSIWVVKASEIVASQPEESGEFFRSGGKQGLPSSDVLHHP